MRSERRGGKVDYAPLLRLAVVLLSIGAGLTDIRRACEEQALWGESQLRTFVATGLRRRDAVPSRGSDIVC